MTWTRIVAMHSLRTIAIGLFAVASPCPPPPPPVFEPPECPTAAVPISAKMYPGCYSNDCTSYGIQKAYDGRTRGLSTLAISSYVPAGGLVYFQYDLGQSPPIINAVRITARSDANLRDSQNLNVYLSSNATYADPRNLCQANVRFSSLGETQVLLCPTGLSTRFVSAHACMHIAYIP